MKRPRTRILTWLIATLAILALVGGGVLVNVQVLGGQGDEPAGSLSPVIETRTATPAAPIATAGADPVAAVERRARAQRLETARRRAAAATERTPTSVPDDHEGDRDRHREREHEHEADDDRSGSSDEDGDDD